MDEKAQGALEYLLLIGGAVLIAAIVIGLLVTQSTSAKEHVETSTQTSQNTFTKIEEEAFGEPLPSSSNE